MYCDPDKKIRILCPDDIKQVRILQEIRAINEDFEVVEVEIPNYKTVKF